MEMKCDIPKSASEARNLTPILELHSEGGLIFQCLMPSTESVQCQDRADRRLKDK